MNRTSPSRLTDVTSAPLEDTALASLRRHLHTGKITPDDFAERAACLRRYRPPEEKVWSRFSDLPTPGPRGPARVRAGNAARRCVAATILSVQMAAVVVAVVGVFFSLPLVVGAVIWISNGGGR